MAEKIERRRGWYQNRVVTILKGKVESKRGKLTIRDRGFVKEVDAKDVEPVQSDERIATLRFEPPHD